MPDPQDTDTVVKTSFAQWMIESSQPDLRFDLAQLDAILREQTRIDALSLELERIGSGSALAIRTEALRWLGIHLTKRYHAPRPAMRFLAQRDRAIALWAACALARETLLSFPESEVRPQLCIEAVEAAIRREVPLESISEAERDLIELTKDPYVPSSPIATAADVVQSVARLAVEKYEYAVPLAERCANTFYLEKTRSKEEVKLQRLRLVRVIGTALPGMPNLNL